MAIKKETSIFVGILLAIIIAVFFVFYFNEKPSPFTTRNIAKSAHPVSKIKIDDVSANDASAAIGYNIIASYPKISGFVNENSQTEINADLKKIVEDEENQFKQEINLSNKTIQIKGEATLNMSYKINQADDKIVSVWFSVSDFQLGAAHPNNFNLTYNYDLRAGRQIKLADLFATGSVFVPTLSDMTIKDLESQSELKGVLGLSDFVKQGAAPKEENFQLFNLTQNSLVLIFNPGTVAPEFAGTRTVIIPFSNLKQSLLAH